MKEDLLKTARQLIPPAPEHAGEFSQKCEAVAVQGCHVLFKRKDLDKLIGENNEDMAGDNNRNFARFMNALFSDYSPEVFVDTVLWVYRAYRSHGFQTTYWATNLNIWVDLLRQELSEEAFSQIYPYYNWLIVNIPIFTKLTDAPLTGCPPHEPAPSHHS